MFRNLLGTIKTLERFRQRGVQDRNPTRWIFKIIYMDGSVTMMDYDTAIQEHREQVAYYANQYKWPLHYPEWKWAANYEECRTPFDLIGDA